MVKDSSAHEFSSLHIYDFILELAFVYVEFNIVIVCIVIVTFATVFRLNTYMLTVYKDIKIDSQKCPKKAYKWHYRSNWSKPIQSINGSDKNKWSNWIESNENSTIQSNDLIWWD